MQVKTPKVSVCVVTYNQEKYIRQCLQSIVDQETDFDFEVIVGDDCSTDGTRAIVQEFAEKYPDIVIPIFHEKNIGGTQNYFSVHKLAKGEYVAHIDGDDWWLPNKLSYQVNIIKNNNLVFVADYIGDLGKNHLKYKTLNSKELFKENNPAVHSSKLYRAQYIINVYEDREYIDFEMSLLQLGINGCCALTKKTTIHRLNSDTSIRQFVSAQLINCYIKVCDFSKTIEIKNKDTEIIYNKHIKSFIKQAIFSNDRCGIDDIRTIVNNCTYKLQGTTKLYLFLALQRYSSYFFRLIIIKKRKILGIL